MYSIKDNLLYKDEVQVNFVDTPNKSEGSITPLYLVMHYTADIKKEQAVNWLKDKKAIASAHLVFELDGSITQMVKFNKRAWHAGDSKWEGIEGLNSFSIGIEIVNPGRLIKRGEEYFFKDIKISPENVLKAKHKNETIESYWYIYNEIQLKEVKKVADLLVSYYKLKEIIGHDDISPKRKSDPGPAFPMEKFKNILTCLRYTTTANINLRVGAGINYKAITVIPKGMNFLYELIRQGDWSRVSYNGQLGWVNNKYLKEY